MHMKFPVICMLVCLGWISVMAQYSRVDPMLLQRFEKGGRAEYIVLMKDRVKFGHLPAAWSKEQRGNYVFSTLLAKAEKTQAPVISLLMATNTPYQSFYVVNAIKVTSGIELMKEIAYRDDVELVLDNTPMKMLDYEVSRDFSSSRGGEPEWGLKMIKADSVWALGYRGQGVVISGQDTGYEWGVSPLKSKYRGYVDSTLTNHNYNWHDAIHKNNPIFPDSVLNSCGYSLAEPCDDNTHGTHTMGTMVGEDDQNSIGVAPDARWIGCRNMDRGWGQPTTYIECFEWLLAPYDLNGQNADPAKAPHVINNSWYCSTEEGCNPSNFAIMEEVVNNLRAAGVVVVVSAGNSGNEGCGSVTGPPAFFEGSFSVGATNSNDMIAGFSSRGPVVIDSSLRLKPNVSAPGVGVRSVVRGGGFAFFNGTSMAGPHVAGLVGLIISANPALAGRVEVIENIIESTADAKTDTTMCGNVPGMSIPNPIYGYGRVNALAAVRKALEFTTGVTDPAPFEVSVYPNPTSGWVSFATAGDHTVGEVQIFTLSGSMVSRSMANKDTNLLELDMSGLAPGLYLYRLFTKNHTVTGKLIRN